MEKSENIKLTTYFTYFILHKCTTLIMLFFSLSMWLLIFCGRSELKVFVVLKTISFHMYNLLPHSALKLHTN